MLAARRGATVTASTINSSEGDQDSAHFAGLEHDPESGTEHAEYRNYASAQGRWLAPDPYDGSCDFSNPQTFNRYAYVGNNPLSFTDPSGQDFCGVTRGRSPRSLARRPRDLRI